MAKIAKQTSKKTEASDKDAFELEIASFLAKNVEGISVEALEGREQVPYWIQGTHALNWVVSGTFKSKGTMPGTKAIIISGECLCYDTNINIETDNKDFLSFLKDKNVNQTINIGYLFKIISDYLKITLEKEKLTDISELKLKIKNENNKLINVNKIVIKEKPTRTIYLKADDLYYQTINCSNEHLICLDPSKPEVCTKAIDIKEGMELINSKNEKLIVLKNVDRLDLEIVYDFQVESDTHLYQDSNGIVHHNSGKGKSFVADIFLGEQIKRGGIGIKLEVEDAGGIEFTSKIIGDEAIAKKIMIIGPTPDKSGEIKPITIEKLTSILNKLINKQLSVAEENRKEIVFVIDSVSQLTSEKEYEDIQKDDDKRDMTPQQKLRALFRNLTQQFRLAKLTVIGIAHKTANIGVMFGPKMVTNAKGSGFGYASSLSLEIVSNKDIEDEKTKIPIAIKMRVRTEKNRFQYKGRQCWLKFNFGRGIEKYFGLSEILVQHAIATSSAKASVMGELGETSTIKWTNPNDSKEYSWKVKEEEAFVKSWPNGEDELFKIWEKQLEDKIIEITGGVVPIDAEDLEDEEELDYEDLNLVEQEEMTTV